MNPQISICVPAWRGSTLRRFLASIKIQSGLLSYELIVQDDCSPHGVRIAFDEEFTGVEPWYYYSNDKNFGGYRNIWQCTRQARGKYLLIISDDDTLIPDAFEILKEVCEKMEQSNAGASFLYDRLKTSSGMSIEVEYDSFRWLRDVSVNVPAFISAVVWRTKNWNDYPYNDLPDYFSLPQLHLFVRTCLAGPLVVSCKSVVSIGRADETDNPSYWFYRKNPPLDLLEYPFLYSVILNSHNVKSIKTSLMIRLRRLRWRSIGVKKLMFIAYNKNYYKMDWLLVVKCDQYGFSARFMWILSYFFLHTRFGGSIAGIICNGKPRLVGSNPDADGRRF